MRASRRHTAGPLPVLAAAATALVASGSDAATPDTSAWKCERCPFAAGYRAELGAGVVYVSDDAATVGDATGLDARGTYADVAGHGRLATASHRLDWLAEDLGLDSRVAELEGARPGVFDYRLAYRQIPRHRYDAIGTIFGHGTDHLLTLPAAWTFAGTTSGFADLAGSLRTMDIESERRTLEVGGRYLPTSRFRLFAEYGRQERDGTGVLGGSYFTNSSLLPRRFDYRTDQVDAGIRYDADRGYLQLAYYGSFFSNRYAAVRWQSPFLTLPGAAEAAIAEPPDNDFQQLVLTAAYQLASLDTRVNFSAALGRGTQDDLLLPYTTNASLATGPLPASSPAAEVDTGHLALTVVSVPFPRARVKFAIRYDERDNGTPILPWSRVIADSFLSGETEFNVPYGFDRLRMNLRGDYRLGGNLRVSAGYDYTETDRQYQEVDEQTEDTGWGRVQWRPAAWLDVSALGGIARRDVGTYDRARAANFGQNPLLRKYHLAYRYRQFGEISASASPPDWPLTLGARMAYADDSYSSTSLGLTGRDELRLALDISWPASDRVVLYLTGGYDKVESTQTGSAAFATPDWHADQSDEFYSVGGGLRVSGIADRLDLQLDFTRASGRTGIEVVGGGGPGHFPDLESTLDSFRMQVRYRWSASFETRLLLRHEKFPTEDWALEGVAPDTLPTVLTLGARPYDDAAWLVGIGFRYSFSKKTP